MQEQARHDDMKNERYVVGAKTLNRLAV